MIKGMESNCPMSRSMPASKSTWMSLAYSMKKRATNTNAKHMPKKYPVPTFCLFLRYAKKMTKKKQA